MRKSHFHPERRFFVIPSEVEESVFLIRESMEPGYNSWVYIITNRTHTVLYIGMTNDLARRTSEHREGIGAGFPTAFHCRKLIYYEHYWHVQDAIAREQQLKNWSRAKKVALIRTLNPNWNDLGVDVLQDPYQRQIPRLRSE